MEICLWSISFLWRKVYCKQILLMTWGCGMILTHMSLSHVKVTGRKSAKLVTIFYFLIEEHLKFLLQTNSSHYKKSIICVCFNLSFGETSEFPTSLKYYDLRMCDELDSCLLKLEGYKFWSLDLLYR